MTIKIEAKSLQLALLKAAGQLGITQSELGYKIIKEYHGLWGLFGKKVAIEAWVVAPHKGRSGRGSTQGRQRSAPREQGRAAQQASRKSERSVKERRFVPKEVRDEGVEKPQLTPAELAALKEDLKEFCAGLIRHISGEEGTVAVSEMDDRLVFAVTCPGINEPLGKNMKFVEALEHLIRKKPKHLHQEMPFRIFVDINGVRQDREGELAVLARDLSDKVFASKRPIVLNYRSSYDRKIIHMALDKDERVYTKSIGSGPNRKLMILPVRQSAQEIGNR